MELKKMKRKNIMKIGQIFLAAMLITVTIFPITLGSLVINNSNEELESTDMNILDSEWWKLKISVDSNPGNPSLYFRRVPKGTSEEISVTFTVANTDNDRTIDWDSEIVSFYSKEITYEDFLVDKDFRLSPTSGTLKPGKSQTVTMTFDFDKETNGEELQKFAFALKVYDKDLKDLNYDKANIIVQTNGYYKSRSLSHSDVFPGLYSLLQARFPLMFTLLQRLPLF